jgi:hypothetical protein
MIETEYCCKEVFFAISSENKVPISAEMCGDIGRKFYRFNLEFVDDYNPEEELKLYGEFIGDDLIFCPFCGKQILPCDIDLFGEWKKRQHMCESFLEWFMKGNRYPNMKTPTPMFKYEPTENQFYMHHRKGFGEGWIPIKYCIYCGEPLSEMVEKYGLSKFIAAKLDPSEWQGRHKLCRKEPKITDYSKFPGFIRKAVATF